MNAYVAEVLRDLSSAPHIVVDLKCCLRLQPTVAVSRQLARSLGNAMIIIYLTFLVEFIVFLKL